MSSLKLSGKRIGIMGGSFDPLHNGHLIIAQDAIEQLDLSEVLFIPAAVPPHKQGREQVSGEKRLEMLELALKRFPNCSASDIELKRGGISFTVDTIGAIKKDRPDARLVLIIGSDTVIDLHNWYRVNDLLELCEVATFLRPGDGDLQSIREKIELNEEQSEKLLNKIFHAHLVEISSTEIRMRVKSGKNIRSMVPPEVEEYIYEHGLYGGEVKK